MPTITRAKVEELLGVCEDDISVAVDTVRDAFEQWTYEEADRETKADAKELLEEVLGELAAHISFAAKLLGKLVGT